MSGLSEDRSRAESFGLDAERYERCRPSWPPELIGRLTAEANEPWLAVDVGCGTGKVARLLVDNGWDVVGVEPDVRMAAVAAQRGLRVDVARFEDWVPSVHDAELVCAGQSWHWVDQSAGLAKAAEVLRSGGRIALLWNAYRYAPEVDDVIANVCGRIAPQLLQESVAFGAHHRGIGDGQVCALDSSPLFEHAQQRLFEHARTQSVADWIDELRTHSVHLHLASHLVQELLDGLRQGLDAATGSTLSVRYETTVTTGLRR